MSLAIRLGLQHFGFEVALIWGLQFIYDATAACSRGLAGGDFGLAIFLTGVVLSLANLFIAVSRAEVSV